MTPGYPWFCTADNSLYGYGELFNAKLLNYMMRLTQELSAIEPGQYGTKMRLFGRDRERSNGLCSRAEGHQSDGVKPRMNVLNALPNKPARRVDPVFVGETPVQIRGRAVFDEMVGLMRVA